MAEVAAVPGNPTLHMPEWEFQRIYGPWLPMAPTEVASLLRDVPLVWWVAGGWSLEADPRHPRRSHADIDVGFFARDADAVRQRLAGFSLWEAHEGSLRPLLPAESMRADVHQLWVRRDAFSPWVMDVVFSPHEGEDWVYRRDHRIRRPLAELRRTGPDGVPYQTPEIGLLFKARLSRSKDDHDLTETWPRLDDGARRWLRAAVELTESPDHPWLRRMDTLPRP